MLIQEAPWRKSVLDARGTKPEADQAGQEILSLKVGVCVWEGVCSCFAPLDLQGRSETILLGTIP